MKMWTVPVISYEKFCEVLTEYLVHNFKDYSQEEMAQHLIQYGFPKFDPQDLGKCMKALSGDAFMEPVCVDIGDSMFYWLVSGTDAILVHKEFDNTKRCVKVTA
jgi:hypothetical protein